jgi:hypothetical protein
MSEQAYDPEALRSALEHIAASARNSRSSTRRIRWIERRAEMALAGEPYSNETCGDLPKSAGDTAEKARQMMLRERAAAAEALSVLQKQLDAALVDSKRYRALKRDDAIAHEVVVAAFGGDTDDTTDWGKSLDEWCDAVIEHDARAALRSGEKSNG